MANQQVIISVLADVSRFSNRMRSLGSSFVHFGKVAALGVAAIGYGIFKLGEGLVTAAEESAKADQRLTNITKSMGIFGAKASEVTKRLQDYADKTSLATGVDDELIKAGQAKLMTFKNLAKSADEAGGAFDRATMASLDLAAAGFGTSDKAAVMLGKALQDPIKGITALTRVGVTFTEQEKKRIAALVESNKLTEAQNLILGAVETQVGGTATATAQASDKIKVAFENISEEIGSALLPYIAELADALAKWLQDDQTKKFFEDVKGALTNFVDALKQAFNDPAVQDTFKRLNNGIQKFFDYMASPQGKRDMEKFAGTISSAFAAVNETLMFTLFGLNAIGAALQGNWGALNMTYDQFKAKYFPKYSPQDNLNNAPGGTSVWRSTQASAAVTVNFNAPVDSVSAGREVARVLADYHRTRGVM